MNQAKICFIGAGNMSRSIISGLVTSGYDANLIYATNPSQPKLTALMADFGIHTSNDNYATAQLADVIVLSVKPQMMAEVCQALATLDLSHKLIITIAAGVPAARYQDYFAQPLQLIRAMPNTPSQIGYGMCGLFATDTINSDQKQIAQAIMATGSKTLWVEQESELDLVIALAGSSPAYFFMFMESMLASATAMGMDEAKARLLVEQAALGAAQMVCQNPQLSLAQLRQNVTSKGGTTAEAINTFEQGKLPELVDDAMQNCIARAQQMAKQF